MKKHSTCFTVMPGDTNPKFPLIFGGAFFSKMDLCAAQTINRFFYASKTSRTGVTHKFEGTFLKPCYAGDLIFLESEIVETRQKAVAVTVKAFRERPVQGQAERDLVAEAHFVFVAIAMAASESRYIMPLFLPYVEHGMTMDDPNPGVPDANPSVCRPNDYFG